MTAALSRAELDPLWVPEVERGRIEPVIVRHTLGHRFVRHDGRGCEVCRRGRRHADHLGAPPSLNVFGSSANQFVYQGLKKTWQEILDALLRDARLPKPLGKVMAEGRVCFPTRTRRDQGNYRFLLEKALGDTLTAGGWLEDDDWTRYEFGNLAYVYEARVSWTELVIFPAWPGELDGASEGPQASLL